MSRTTVIKVSHVGPYEVIVISKALIWPYETKPLGYNNHNPSLSFVEYNSSHDVFFTPLVYFLAGHYLDP